MPTPLGDGNGNVIIRKHQSSALIRADDDRLFNLRLGHYPETSKLSTDTLSLRSHGFCCSLVIIRKHQSSALIQQYLRLRHQFHLCHYPETSKLSTDTPFPRHPYGGWIGVIIRKHQSSALILRQSLLNACSLETSLSGNIKAQH